ncbi:Trk system potassium transporter TrkA [Clostridiaceae bacterium AM27-36LB]|nr:Trk system potassium transporter TrkA [Clostridiales bacterium AM23-16LB]RHR45750.1 Trk system potassium transporter TrkA [Clostridiaceae bacterium AF18-31LB]RHT85225.1 Trk system potassium transporter TrkA [Clostridiaceae bacterium AM27-36LB]RHW04131.1 Trk system potassium transporter TrkA [Clostridiaceae bacterium OF09-1]
MNIIIAGCGKVGRALAEQLSREKHDITVIDRKPEAIQQITNIADVRGVVGNGASFEIQMDAGIDTADLMIAVTDADEVNLLCCLIAKKAGGCQTIARVRNPVYHHEIHHIKDELGLSMVINPEWAAAMEMARLLRFPSAIDIDTFANGRIELLRFQLEEQNPLCNNKIKDLHMLSRCEVLICIVERGNEVLIPSGEVELKAGDMISVVASPVNASRFFKTIGIETNQVKNTMIIGGGKISFYLAKRLLEMGIQVKIIEKDRDACERLCEILPKAMIINGDGTDRELLAEEGLAKAEGFAALTNMDEENVMLALYAKSMSKAKKITKVNRNTFDTIIGSLNIGSLIYPKHITSETILQYVRAMQNSIGSNVETLYRLVDGNAEALEFVIKGKSEVTDIPLQELQLKPHILVCAINRKGKIIIPKGQDCIQEGDSVVIITTDCGAYKDIRDIMKKTSGPVGTR